MIDCAAGFEPWTSSWAFRFYRLQHQRWQSSKESSCPTWASSRGWWPARSSPTPGCRFAKVLAAYFLPNRMIFGASSLLDFELKLWPAFWRSWSDPILQTYFQHRITLRWNSRPPIGWKTLYDFYQPTRMLTFQPSVNLRWNIFIRSGHMIAFWGKPCSSLKFCLLAGLLRLLAIDFFADAYLSLLSQQFLGSNDWNGSRLLC